MKCSVVIPVHNGAPFVARAVASVRSQSTAAAELIVVDDGSTDATAEAVEACTPGVTLLRQGNRGPGAARNAGIDAATAPWVAFLDADDVWLPWHLEQLSSLAVAVPDAGMVAGAFVPRRAEEPGPDLAVRSSRSRRRAGTIDYFRAAARDIGVVHTSTVAIRRDLLDELGGFGPAPRGQDLELWAKVALVAPVAASPVTSAVYTLGVGITAAHERESATRGPAPVPTEIGDISPSARVVVDALATGDHLPPASSLRRYLDSRLAWSIRSRVAAGDLEGARALRSLATSPWWPENVGPMTATALPPGLVRRLLDARRSVRRSVAAARSRFVR